MAHYGRRTAEKPNVAAIMAGWLFADLLLVLFLVGIGTQTNNKPPPLPPPPPPPPPSLAKEPVSITLDVRYHDILAGGEARRQAVAEVRGQVAAAVADRQKLGGERAGMVLIWGYHEDVGSGLRISAAVTEGLAEADRTFFGNSTLRSFWGGGRQPKSRVMLEIYVLK